MCAQFQCTQITRRPRAGHAVWDESWCSDCMCMVVCENFLLCANTKRGDHMGLYLVSAQTGIPMLCFTHLPAVTIMHVKIASTMLFRINSREERNVLIN